jgi:hypothetical protein
MPSPGMLRRVAFVRNNVSEEPSMTNFLKEETKKIGITKIPTNNNNNNNNNNSNNMCSENNINGIPKLMG